MQDAITAETMLDEFREGLVRKIELARNVLLPLYPRASEAQQILMMGPLDEAREAERLLEALVLVRSQLAHKAEPHRDPTPPRRPGR